MTPMSTILLALLMQSVSISGGLATPDGMPAPTTAQVVLLPSRYVAAFDAEVQRRLDDYWESYKGQFARQKELFYQVIPLAHRDALDSVIYQMQRDSTIKVNDLVKEARGGLFEFRGVSSGNYKLVAIAAIGNKQYVWTESVTVGDSAVFLLMKNRQP